MLYTLSQAVPEITDPEPVQIQFSIFIRFKLEDGAVRIQSDLAEY